jgi:hypothetical protein
VVRLEGKRKERKKIMKRRENLSQQLYNPQKEEEGIPLEAQSSAVASTSKPTLE